ncbi:MAG: beta-propeller fold lactonase family protein [Methanobacterium sp.]|nr:beta-propeller fold lactonase family protein [Methanobacterium sp.]
MKKIKKQLILLSIIFIFGFIFCGAASAAQYADLQVSNSNCVVSSDGQTADFSLTVTNNGPSTAQNVVLQDQMLGVDVKSSQYSINNGAWQDWNQHYITLGTMNAGSSVLVQFQADVTGTSLANRAQVSSTTTDLIRTNNVQIYKTQAAYTIIATAGTGGTIQPNGNVNVYTGNSQSFTITPNTGYVINDVLVDGVSIGAVPSYTFNDVTNNHTINATFKTTARFAYISNRIDNTISVIDIKTNTVTANIPVGYNPQGVAFTPDGSKVYVANSSSDTVSVINTATNTITATIPVGFYPWGVAFTPDGSKAYVTNYYSNNVSVIDTATNTVIGSPISVGDGPIGVAVTPDGSKAYVVNYYGNNVSVINTIDNTVTTTINVDSGPFGVAFTPDGSKAYVTNYDNSTVSVIDTATNTVIGNPIPVGYAPTGVAVTPDGSKAYVANWNSNTVSVINTLTNTVTTTINVGIEPIGVAFTPDGSKAYVANSGSNTVSVIDTANNIITNNILVGNNPCAFGNFIG